MNQERVTYEPELALHRLVTRYIVSVDGQLLGWGFTYRIATLIQRNRAT